MKFLQNVKLQQKQNYLKILQKYGFEAIFRPLCDYRELSPTSTGK